MSLPKIDFDVDEHRSDKHRDYRFARLTQFWEPLRDWLEERGYTLYTHILDPEYKEFEYAIPARELTGESHFPFPYIDHDSSSDKPPLSTDYTESGNIVYAQDSQSHHVVLKLVKSTTEECAVYGRLLQNQSYLENFSCVIPVLNMIPYEDHQIVVMPRWGTYPLTPVFRTYGHVLHYMHCMLKGLAYLHSLKIVHFDLGFGNLLVNHLSSDIPSDLEVNQFRFQLREKGLLDFALIDFDCARIFPLSATPAQCRLPSRGTATGSFHPPLDTALGEVDFDPFAWDVGSLGVYFCSYYQDCIPAIPMLAPLLDGMVMYNASRRFTATEALTFFEDIRAKLSDDSLQQTYRASQNGTYWYEDDRWEDLPEDFVRDWSSYRLPKRPKFMRLIFRICEYRWGYEAIYFLRKFSQWLLPSSISGWFHIIPE